MAFGRNSNQRPSVSKKKKPKSAGKSLSQSKRTSVSKKTTLTKSTQKKLKVKSTTSTPVIKQTRTAQNPKSKAKNSVASSHIMGHQIRSHESNREKKQNTKRHKNSKRRKKIFLICLVAIIVVGIGITAGVIGFLFHTSNTISVDADTKKALAKVQENTPTYMVFAANTKRDSSVDSLDYDMLMLCRVDFADKQVIITSIPTDTYVANASGGASTLADITKNNGDAALIEATSSFADSGINYFVKMDAQGISDTVDYFGGIDVNLKEEIDQPSAGNSYISSGQTHLDGESTLTLLRADQFNGGNDTITDNKLQFARGLTSAIFAGGKFDMNPIIEQICQHIRTNMSVGDLNNFYDRLKGLDSNTIQTQEVPGSRSLRDNKKVFIVDATEWKEMRQKMSYGTVDKDETQVTTADIDPGSFTIQVQNGAGVDGAAAMVANQLTSQGYKVTETGNADTNIYKETLVIYNTNEMKKNAQAVRNTINNGRLVQANGMYNLKTDVLVIIGADLKI